MRTAAYVYPGWHAIAERDAAFHPGFTEWELVADCRPRFAEHWQPRVPALGTYDDRDPEAVATRVELARAHGIDALIYGLFWCRGKRVFEAALDQGFLGSRLGSSMPFAVMWANRMPRRVLPVRRADLPVIDASRRVPSDEEDFVELVGMLAREYFHRPNYLRVGGDLYLSIFDTTFFLLELGLDGARRAIAAARCRLQDQGLGGLHLAAIDPSAAMLPELGTVGFDSVTHYVYLPEWKGPQLQDYASHAAARAGSWASFGERSGLPYMPSVAPGWDASPRGADFGATRPDRYPWSPVVVGSHPDRFATALGRAVDFVREGHSHLDPLVMVASLNEWSEGHYLEPDERFGEGWLQAVARARR